MSRGDYLAAMFAGAEDAHYRALPGATGAPFLWAVEEERVRNLSDAELACERNDVRAARDESEATARAASDARGAAFVALRDAMERYVNAAHWAIKCETDCGRIADTQHTILAEVLRRCEVAAGNRDAAIERLAILK